jgi:hypothetical protein
MIEMRDVEVMFVGLPVRRVADNVSSPKTTDFDDIYYWSPYWIYTANLILAPSAQSEVYFAWHLDLSES